MKTRAAGKALANSSNSSSTSSPSNHPGQRPASYPHLGKPPVETVQTGAMCIIEHHKPPANRRKSHFSSPPPKNPPQLRVRPVRPAHNQAARTGPSTPLPPFPLPTRPVLENSYTLRPQPLQLSSHFPTFPLRTVTATGKHLLTFCFPVAVVSLPAPPGLRPPVFRNCPCLPPRAVV